MPRIRFTKRQPPQLRHAIGTRVRVAAEGKFKGHAAEVVGYTTAKVAAYGLCFNDHPWQRKEPGRPWLFTEDEIVLD